ncbi:hypothetical protein GH714_001614 [Hevea brasiliensis]|uniref:PB1 domain-containing protein n=1 Tax=Hevea brasiliensis TaxID=3981 RepID=A0A6A6LUA6_HEVBR|nr:hypothetical protein GH714_001382 [Hevea brasiliensis]KAF2305075.1 hypothetical protein GH714_001614 [Hevea brasiliensis]
MASLQASELESAATDSGQSSPRSDQYGSHDPRVRFMCSFGGIANLSVKYQLPNEDLDALISVTTDEDVDNMMEEYDRVLLNQNPRSARLRLFLFSNGEDSRTSSISSLLDGSTNREHWFFDALNSGSSLQRERSEASSIVSEVPDYLFGLDNSDDPQPRENKAKSRLVLHDNVSASDPGSPAPVVSSPYCSTSSAVPIVPSIPDLPPVKTKPENTDPIIQPKQNTVDSSSETIEPVMTHPTGYPSNPVMHYIPDSHYPGHHVQPIPVYYVPGPVPPGNVPVQPVQIRPPFVQQYPVSTGPIPVGYQQGLPGMGQVYGGAAIRPMTALDPYEGGRVVPDGVNQQVYYGVRNATPGMVPGYPGTLIPGGEDLQRTVSDTNSGRVSNLNDN